MNLQSIFLWCAALAVLSGQVTPESYLWPLDAPPALTSTYAEYRSGRFHAGLDVKTWGKEGYACVSVADGYVWRVRTSPWGYGKAVYLKLVDGRTAVYAHLSGFVDRIESVVAAEQDRRGAYSVNLYFPPGEIPVTRGDRIAFTGSTGSGFPHLHFEIRDGQQRPLNPLLNGFGVKDTTFGVKTTIVASRARLLRQKHDCCVKSDVKNTTVASKTILTTCLARTVLISNSRWLDIINSVAADSSATNA